MSPQPAEPGSTGRDSDSRAARVSVDRLRERTDELELIISGLSLLALLAVPGAIWDAYEQYYLRFSLEWAAATAVAIPIVTAICHTMVLLLILHLAVRAHWVGLIGLNAVFPDGVRWERIDGEGPVTLERLRARIGSLESAIARADRAASTLFSLITFTALALAILGAWFGIIFAIASLFGSQLGGVNTFINRAIPWLTVVYFAAPTARWLLDGVLLQRVPRLAALRPLRWLVRLLGFVEGLFLPTRLLGITRLTLQSQLLPRSFLALFLLAVLLILWSGSETTNRARLFDLFGSQQYVSGRDTFAGMRSAHYESQRVPRDRLRPAPLIPAPIIETAWLPLFLPYVALMDDPVLLQRCPPRPAAPAPPTRFDANDTDADATAREAAVDVQGRATAACLRTLWEVRLDGVPQSLESFMPAERGDLGMRGLSGFIPLNGTAPGLRRLEVIWRPRPEQDRLDEDYVPQRLRHVIPFLWSPDAAAAPAAAS
jgi:hypothetical protein